MQAQPVTAASHAMAILSAWDKKDALELQRELILLQQDDAASADSLEAERMDLLAGITAELLRRGKSTGVCRTLLRHVAATPFRATRSKARSAVQ